MAALIAGGGARRLLAGGAVAIALALPLVIASPYDRDLLNLCLIYILLTIGFNFTFGYTGQISLGHIGFWAIGAYATALLTVESGWSPLPAAAVGIVLSVIAAAGLGWTTRNLSHHYLALATFAFAAIVQVVLLNWVALTGGPNGVGGIPPLSVAGIEIPNGVPLYYATLAVVIAGGAFAWRWQTTRFGRRSFAIRRRELTAQSLGVRTGRLKVTTLMISAAFAAVAGSLYAHQTQFVSPDVFGFAELFKVLAMLVIGGAGLLSGAIVGAVLLVFLPEWFRGFDEYWQLLYGVLLLVLVLRMPWGVSGAILRLVRRLAARQEEPRSAGDPKGGAAHDVVGAG